MASLDLVLVPSIMNLSETKKKFLAAGLMTLCALSLLWSENYGNRKVLGLSELLALSGIWVCLVWLWSERFARRCFELVKWVAMFLCSAIEFFFLWGLILALPILMIIYAVKEKDGSIVILLVVEVVALALVILAGSWLKRRFFPSENYRQNVPQQPRLPGASDQYMSKFKGKSPRQ